MHGSHITDASAERCGKCVSIVCLHIKAQTPNPCVWHYSKTDILTDTIFLKHLKTTMVDTPASMT